MATVIFFSACAAGLFLMRRFRAALGKEASTHKAHIHVASFVSPRSGVFPAAHLGSTYAYQDAVLRWRCEPQRFGEESTPRQLGSAFRTAMPVASH
jgi:hypothetical protein